MAQRVVSVFLTLVALLSPSGSAFQEPRAQQSTFRSSVALVPVDVVVTDARGNPVLDLTREDFTILEDGVPQAIRHFSIERLTAAESVVGPGRAVPRSVSALELAPQQRRVFLVVLSRRGNEIQHPTGGLDALLEFVRSQALPQDEIAVMAYNRATAFTTDHATIARTIERFQARSDKVAALLAQYFSGLRAVYGSGKIPDDIQREIDAIFEEPGAASGQAIPMSYSVRGAVAPTLKPQAPAAEGVESTDTSFSDLVNAEMAFDEFVSKSQQTMQSLSQMFAGLQYMRHLEGQKHLVLMGGSLNVPRLDDDTGLAAMANDARVAIDFIQTGGLAGPGMRNGELTWDGDNMTQILDNQSMRMLARLTGGQAFIASYSKPAFGRIDNVTRAQYLLGYYPSNPNWNGKYRRVEVKVKREGVQVTSRHGYYGRRTPVPYDRKEFLAYTRIASAAAADMQVHDIGLKAEISRGDGQRSPSAPEMTITIDVSRIGFQVADDRHAAQFRIAVFFGDDKGRPIDQHWNTMQLKLKEETYRKALGTGVRYTLPLPAKSRPKYAKIVVYNYESDVVGSVEKELR